MKLRLIIMHITEHCTNLRHTGERNKNRFAAISKTARTLTVC